MTTSMVRKIYGIFVDRNEVITGYSIEASATLENRGRTYLVVIID
jgi:hypothetical protein